MLILVAVTITIALQGGLFTQAQNAGKATEQAIVDEQLQIILVAAKAASYADSNLTFKQTVQEGLKGQSNWQFYDPGVDNVIIDNKGNAYGIGEDYTPIKIPKGFYYAEGTKNTGFVITDKLNASGDSIGNEFVWIPVDNPGSMYQVNSDLNNGNLMGQLYDFSGTTPTKIVGFGSPHREPDVVGSILTDQDFESTSFTNIGMPGITEEQFKNQLQTEFNEMISSVKKHKGFYCR